jgi:exopolysaccharide biosynthesis polyprenyl glycosylphosphotransferase
MGRAMMRWIRRPRSRRLLILAHDVFVIAAAFPLAIALAENFTFRQQHIVSAVCGTLLLLVIASLVWRAMRIQQTMWSYASSDELLAVVKALCAIMVLFLASMFFLNLLDNISRSVLILFWAVSFAGLFFTRIAYCSAVKAYRRRQHRKERNPTYRVLIQAGMEEASAAIHAFQRYHGSQADIVGIISDNAEKGRLLHGIEILGGADQIGEALASLDVTGRYPQVIVLGDSGPPSQEGLINALAINEITMIRVTDIPTYRADISSGTAVIGLPPSAFEDKPYVRAKRFIDLAVTSFALVFLAPLLLIISSAIYLLDGAPVLFVQVRAGKGLHQFHLLKFRTMRPPIDKSGRALAEDERVTWLGSMLRATRADELPQLWNVLKGEMSLVGPRPLLCRDMPKEVGTLAERYCIRPGITGWAQVNGGKKIGNDAKIPLDIYYIRNISLDLDIKIMLMTVGMLINGEKVTEEAISIRNIEDIKTRTF